MTHCATSKCWRMWEIAGKCCQEPSLYPEQNLRHRTCTFIILPKGSHAYDFIILKYLSALAGYELANFNAITSMVPTIARRKTITQLSITCSRWMVTHRAARRPPPAGRVRELSCRTHTPRNEPTNAALTVTVTSASERLPATLTTDWRRLGRPLRKRGQGKKMLQESARRRVLL